MNRGRSVQRKDCCSQCEGIEQMFDEEHVDEDLRQYRAEGPDATALHMAEFFDCVRTRKQCSENAEVGHHAAAAGHMVNLSYRTGKRILWDASSGTVKS